MESVLATYKECVADGGLDWCCLRRDGCCWHTIHSYQEDREQLDKFINDLKEQYYIELSNFIQNLDKKSKFSLNENDSELFTFGQAYEKYKTVMKQFINTFVETSEQKNNKYVLDYIHHEKYINKALFKPEDIRIVEQTHNISQYRFDNDIEIKSNKKIYRYSRTQGVSIQDTDIEVKEKSETNDHIIEILKYQHETHCCIDEAILQMRKDTWLHWCQTFRYLWTTDKLGPRLTFPNIILDNRIKNKRSCANAICLTFIFIIAIVAIILALVLSIREIVN